MISVRSTYPDGTDSIMLNQLGEVSGWKHTHMYPGGPTSASFNFQGSTQLNPAALQMGRLVYAYSGTALVWSGRLNSPQKAVPWSLTANGTAALAKDHINGTGAVLNTQIDAAITDGLPWFRSASLTAFNPAPALGDTINLSDTSTVDDLLGVCIQQGNYWNVTPQGVLSMSSTPVFARSYLLWATDWPAQTQNNFATIVYGLWNDGTNPGPVVVSAPTAILKKYGRIETTFDTGTTTSGAATTAATVKLGLLLQPAWTGPFTANYGQLVTTGGTPVDLATVGANCTVRVCVLQTGDSYGVGPVDIPMGQIDYDDNSGTLQLTPSNVDLDDFKNVLVQSYA